MSRIVLTMMVCLAVSVGRPARAVELQVAGFADVTAGAPFGAVADESDEQKFETFGQGTFPTNYQRGFALVGTDFVVTADLTDNFTYLGEINFQVARGESAEIEVDPERFFVDYRIIGLANLQGGLFFTPIGFHNRKHYSRAVLMRSASVPDLFEEELNLVTTHTTGVALHGSHTTVAGHILGYTVSVGNGRGYAPTDILYARDTDEMKQVTAMVEWGIPGLKELHIGLSGYYDEINSYDVPTLGGSVDTADPLAQKIELSEIVANPYLDLESRFFNLTAEYVMVRHTDLKGNLGDRSWQLNGFLVEVSLNLLEDGRLHPYVRFDHVAIPDTDPYFGLRSEEGGVLTSVYVPDVSLGIAGVAFDVTGKIRVKAEYHRNFDGPRAENALLVQTAWGF